MQIPNDFFTATSLATFAGATLVIWVIISSLGMLIDNKGFQNNKKWVAFGLSIVLSFVAAALTSSQTAWTWVIAIPNGFLLFLTSMGTNTITSHPNQGKTETIAAAPPATIGGGTVKAKPSADEILHPEAEVTPITNRVKFNARW